MSSPFIIFDNVAVRSGSQLYFAGAHWRVHDDEQWALIGPTGAGKSLLVKVLQGQFPVVQGKILYFFDGAPHGRSYLQRGEIALVSAEKQRELLQEYTGYHQARWQSSEGQDAPRAAELLTGASIEHTSPYEVTHLSVDETVYAARRKQAVEWLGIANLLERNVIHLSHGEMRKVLLARALMQAPRLLILDDPFGGLDQASRATLAHVLANLLAEGRQRLLLVTSRQDEIPPGVTHVLGVDGCRLATQGARATVLGGAFAQETLGQASSAAARRASDTPAKRETSPMPVSGWETLPPGVPLIDMRHVTVRYQGLTILDDITWNMQPGEHWAIRGPNGAGKSTLLSLILADNPQAYANQITLFGKPRGSGESIWDIKRHIGWVAPELSFFYRDHGNCLKVVCSGFFDSIGLYRQASAAQVQRARDWMQALDIAALADHPFQSLSVGEQRLVLLARALAKQPLLLILDEPCQGLDAPHRKRIVHLLDVLCRQTPLSLLYVTHHTDELPQAITHVMELEQGRLRNISQAGTDENGLA